MVVEGTLKGAKTGGSTQNLQILSYVRKISEEKENKYAARRAERNMRTLALGRYVCAVSRGEERRASVLIVFLMNI